jgi:hypothetical protein
LEQRSQPSGSLVGSAAPIGADASIPSDLTTVRGVVGSEKKAFFADPEVKRIFALSGLSVEVDTAGSPEIATSVDLRRTTSRSGPPLRPPRRSNGSTRPLACTRRSTPRWRSRRFSQSSTCCRAPGGQEGTCWLPGVRLCSTLLGIAWLTRRFRPLLVPILLVSSVPFAFAITEVTSLGNVLLLYLFAFGLLGREMALGRTASIAGRPPKASHAVHTDATGSGAGSANRDQMTQ